MSDYTATQPVYVVPIGSPGAQPVYPVAAGYPGAQWVAVVASGTAGAQPVYAVAEGTAGAQPVWAAVGALGYNTYYVDAAGGSDSNDGRSSATAWKTITKVNSATLRAGDVVAFKRGETWSGTTLTTQSGVTYADYGSGALPIIDGASRTVNGIAVITKNNVTLRNLEVQDGYDFCVEISNGSTNILVDGLVLHGAGNDNLIVIDACQNITIQNCTSSNPVERVAGPTITCYEIADRNVNVTLANCTGSGSPQMGLSLHAHTGEYASTGVVVRNCTFSGNTQHGAQIFNEGTATNPAGTNVTFTGCTFTGNTGKGVNITRVSGATNYPAGVTLDQCRIYDNTAAGTYQLEIHGTDIRVTRCLIKGLNERAVGIADAVNLVLYNNTIYVAAGTAFVGAVVLTGSANNGVQFKNNIVAVNSTQVLVMQVQANAGAGFVADYNDYFTPSGAAANRWQWNGGANTTFANWKTQSSGDAHGAHANPLFTNAATNDFTLQAGSPCINAGVDVGLPYSGSAPDIGAYEKA